MCARSLTIASPANACGASNHRADSSRHIPSRSYWPGTRPDRGRSIAVRREPDVRDCNSDPMPRGRPAVGRLVEVRRPAPNVWPFEAHVRPGKAGLPDVFAWRTTTGLGECRSGRALHACQSANDATPPAPPCEGGEIFVLTALVDFVLEGIEEPPVGDVFPEIFFSFPDPVELQLSKREFGFTMDIGPLADASRAAIDPSRVERQHFTAGSLAIRMFGFRILDFLRH